MSDSKDIAEPSEKDENSSSLTKEEGSSSLTKEEGSSCLTKEEGSSSLTKEERYNQRQKLMTQNNTFVCPIVRLRRFLYYGDERPIFQPGDRFQKGYFSEKKVPSIGELCIKYEKENPETHRGKEEARKKKIECREKALKQIVQRIEESQGVEYDIPVLKIIEEALQDPTCPYIECGVFALALCARQVLSVRARTQAINVACRQLKSMDLFFMFFKFCKQLSAKSGWGRGLRRLALHFYSQQDALTLAHNVTNQKQYHGWSHRDIMKLAHFKPKVDDISMACLICFLMTTMEHVETVYGENPQAQEIMKIIRLKKVEQETKTDNEMAKLVKLHNLTAEHFRYYKFKGPQLWLAILPKMSTLEVLEALPRVIKYTNRTEVKKRLIAAITQNISKTETPEAVNPITVYLALKNYVKILKTGSRKAFESQWSQEVQQQEKEQGKEESSNTDEQSAESSKKESSVSSKDQVADPLIVFALNQLLEYSFKTLEPSRDKRILLMIDISKSEEAERCSWTHSINAYEAAVVLSLWLAKTYKHLSVFAYAEEGPRVVQMAKISTLNDMMEALKEFKPKEAQLGLPMNWAKERKKDFDVFLIFTQNLNGIRWKGLFKPSEPLQEYRVEMNKPNTRLAVCSFSNMSMSIACESELDGMLDLAGFDPKTHLVLDAFIRGKF